MNVDELAKEIKKHNKLYWENNDPIIEDSEFDFLVSQLKANDPDNSIFTNLEEQKSIEVVGKYKHKVPMLSLEKFYSKAEVLKWMISISRTPEEKFRFELKLDGCSGKNEEHNLATRGDGFLGENHTDKIPYIDFVGCDPYDRNTYVGEIVITDKFFIENLKGDLTPKNYKNSRNAVSGMIGNKDPKKIEGKGVTFVNYDYEKITKVCTVSELDINWDIWKDEFLNLGLPYDGLVIKLADKDYHKELGNKTKTPRGAIAYKFANKSAITKVKGITWQVSRIGKLTPVCELEPIELAGVTICRATAHNYSFLQEKKIVIGSDVVIERAGDVIPKIIKSINQGPVITVAPRTCPCCDTILKYEKDDVDICCSNEYCRDRVIENICFIADTLGIDELGRPTAEKIHNNFCGAINNILDFNNIHYEDLLNLEGYGEKSAWTLFNNIRKSLENVTEVQFLTSFGIVGIGKTLSKKILDDVGGLEELFTIIKDEDKTIERLNRIEGVGDITAKKLIHGNYSRQIYFNYSSFCAKVIVPIREIPKEESVKGKICFTGKGELGRKEYSAISESKGFEPVSSVCSDLNILVTHDPDSQSSKMIKARKNGTKIISYDDFMAIQ